MYHHNSSSIQLLWMTMHQHLFRFTISWWITNSKKLDLISDWHRLCNDITLRPIIRRSSSIVLYQGRSWSYYLIRMNIFNNTYSNRSSYCIQVAGPFGDHFFAVQCYCYKATIPQRTKLSVCIMSHKKLYSSSVFHFFTKPFPGIAYYLSRRLHLFITYMSVE